MYHREEERHALKHHFRHGASVLMVAPRRVGKTWLMERIADDMAEENWNVVFCDVQGMTDEGEFLKHLCDQIEDRDKLSTRAMGHLQQRFRQLLSDGGWTTVQEALGKVNWKTFSEALVKSLNSSGRPTLILVDEISLFLAARLRERDKTALEFLYHLRHLRQRYTNVRWLFTGSIGLDAVARRAVLSGALFGLTPFPLEPFASPVARAFLEHLCSAGKVLRPFELSDESFARLESQLGWLSPYYLEHLANNVKPTGSSGITGQPIATIHDIDHAFDVLLAPHNRLYFAAWEEHISKNFDQLEQRKLRLILDTCARTPNGEQTSTLHGRLAQEHPSSGASELRELLASLVSGGFVREIAATKRYCFRSGLVRRYWAQYHQLDDTCSSPSTNRAA